MTRNGQHAVATHRAWCAGSLEDGDLSPSITGWRSSSTRSRGTATRASGRHGCSVSWWRSSLMPYLPDRPVDEAASLRALTAGGLPLRWRRLAELSAGGQPVFTSTLNPAIRGREIDGAHAAQPSDGCVDRARRLVPGRVGSRPPSRSRVRAHHADGSSSARAVTSPRTSCKKRRGCSARTSWWVSTPGATSPSFRRSDQCSSRARPCASPDFPRHRRRRSRCLLRGRAVEALSRRVLAGRDRDGQLLLKCRPTAIAGRMGAAFGAAAQLTTKAAQARHLATTRFREFAAYFKADGVLGVKVRRHAHSHDDDGHTAVSRGDPARRYPPSEGEATRRNQTSR